MKKIIVSLLGLVSIGISLTPALAATNGRFDPALHDSTSSVSGNLETPIGGDGVTAVKDTIIFVVKDVIIPLVLFAAIVLALIGFYGLISSDKEDTRKKSFNYIIWGVIGIIVMTSATWVANTLVGRNSIFIYQGGQLSGVLTAQALYKTIVFPFLRIAMYLVMGGLFLMALVRAIEMLFKPGDDNGKKVGTIIMWNAIGILVVIFAKQLIEAIYGKEQQIISQNSQAGILADKSIPFVYTVLNWVTGFIGIFLVIMVIIQAIQLLTNPTDENIQKKLRRNVIYMAIGLALIGTSYVVTNFLIAQ